MGTYNKDLKIPFNIQINMVKNESTEAMRDRIYRCNEASDMSHTRCSCDNCKDSCEREEPFPNLEMVSIESYNFFELIIFILRKDVA